MWPLGLYASKSSRAGHGLFFSSVCFFFFAAVAINNLYMGTNKVPAFNRRILWW